MDEKVFPSTPVVFHSNVDQVPVVAIERPLDRETLEALYKAHIEQQETLLKGVFVPTVMAWVAFAAVVSGVLPLVGSVAWLAFMGTLSVPLIASGVALGKARRSFADECDSLLLTPAQGVRARRGFRRASLQLAGRLSATAQERTEMATIAAQRALSETD